MIVIVGAGIVGLSTAYWLASLGESVTVVEQGPIPNPSSASSDHHRMIRAVYGDGHGFAGRVGDALTAWRAMWSDLGGPEETYYAATGVLAVSRRRGDYADLSRKTFDRIGVGYELIEKSAFAERFSFLSADGVAFAHLSDGGALMANALLRDMGDRLRRHGATLMERTQVVAVNSHDGAVTLCNGRTLLADRVVVTAGVGTGRLVPRIAGALAPHRSIALYVDPPPQHREAWQAAPCWADLGAEVELWGMPPVAGLPIKLGNGGLTRNTLSCGSVRAAEARAMLAAYAGQLRDAERYTCRSAIAGHWTGTPDGRFLFHEEGRMLAAVACAGHGFKFGALTGRALAQVALRRAPFCTLDRLYA